MAGNTVKLEFAGDATKLARAGKQAEQAIEGVGKSATSAGADFREAGRETTDYLGRVGKLGAGMEGLSGGFDTAGAAVQAFADIQDAARARAARMARALLDVEQAQEDYNQALRDSKQAAIDSDQAAVDLEQAHLDAAVALTDYNTAVKEHGRDSAEARQAQIDLKQAGVDVKQAQEDSAQAIRDGAQASIDAKSATLNLAEAQKEAKPPQLQQWADNISMITPLLSGMVGVVGLVTAAQWAWNAAQLASPITWIILGIVALVAVIVLIATKTKWFQTAWAASWGWIKKAASNTWEFIKKIPGWIGSAFSKVAGFISAPFRAAFNFVADAWNNTVGRLSWSVPSWVPLIGGNSISVPNLPHFHSGGVVPGTPGSETLAVLQAGERVSTRGGGDRNEEWIRVDLGELGAALLDPIARAVQRRGGSVTALGVRVVNGTVR